MPSTAWVAVWKASTLEVAWALCPSATSTDGAAEMVKHWSPVGRKAKTTSWSCGQNQKQHVCESQPHLVGTATAYRFRPLMDLLLDVAGLPLRHHPSGLAATGLFPATAKPARHHTWLLDASIGCLILQLRLVRCPFPFYGTLAQLPRCSRPPHPHQPGKTLHHMGSVGCQCC